MDKKYKPYMNIGPGAFIKEELETRNWRQEDLGEILGISLKSVNQLIKNKQSITVKTAKLLSKAFGQSPQYWLSLDTNYRLRLSKYDKQEKRVDVLAKIYKYMPIKEMIEKDWIEKYEEPEELQSLVCKFWHIKKLNFKFLDEAKLPNLRKSEAFQQFNEFYAYTWFNMAKRCAEIFAADKYFKGELKELVSEYTNYTLLKTGPQKLIRDLNCIGVKFLVLHHLQKTYIDGAAFCDKANPVIVYTLRYNRIDNFWFTIAHEIAHILLHLKSRDDFFIDNLDLINTKKEKEANKFALKMIKAKEIIEYFRPYGKYISERRVRNCAEEIGVSEAIVVGVLQYNNMLSRRSLNRLKESVSDKIPKKYWAEKHLKKVQITA